MTKGRQRTYLQMVEKGLLVGVLISTFFLIFLGTILDTSSYSFSGVHFNRFAMNISLEEDKGNYFATTFSTNTVTSTVSINFIVSLPSNIESVDIVILISRGLIAYANTSDKELINAIVGGEIEYVPCYSFKNITDVNNGMAISSTNNLTSPVNNMGIHFFVCNPDIKGTSKEGQIEFNYILSDPNEPKITPEGLMWIIFIVLLHLSLFLGIIYSIITGYNYVQKNKINPETYDDRMGSSLPLPFKIIYKANVAIEEKIHHSKTKNQNNHPNNDYVFFNYMEEIIKTQKKDKLTFWVIFLSLIAFFTIVLIFDSSINSLFNILAILDLIPILTGSYEKKTEFYPSIASLTILPRELTFITNIILFLLNSLGILIIIGICYYGSLFLMRSIDRDPRSQKPLFILYNSLKHNKNLPETESNTLKRKQQLFKEYNASYYIKYDQEKKIFELQRVNANWELEKLFEQSLSVIDIKMIIMIGICILSLLYLYIAFFSTLYFFFDTTKSSIIDISNYAFALGNNPFSPGAMIICLFLLPILLFFGPDFYKYYTLRKSLIDIVQQLILEVDDELTQQKSNLSSNDNEIDKKLTLMRLETFHQKLHTLPIYPNWKISKTILKYSTYITVIVQLYNFLVI